MLSIDPSLPPSRTTTSTGTPAIDVHEVTKVYNERSAQPIRALDGLSLTVEAGEIFGLLGQNGAGKTTLLRILTTLIRPTAGRVSLLGLDVVRNGYEARKLICAVLQENAVEVYLSVEDNLTTYARFHSIPRQVLAQRAARAIEQFGLGEHRKQKVIDLSGGLKRRVQVAKVFMVDKPIVFLDEATTGMDPINKRATLDTIRDQARKGRTIFLTTHILEEAEEFCDRIAIIDHGRVVASGDPYTIKSLATTVVDIRVTYTAILDTAYEQLSRYPLKRLEQHHMTIELSVSAHDVSPFDVLQTLGRLGTVLSFEVSSGTLEDAFIELLGKGNTARRHDPSWG